MDSLYREVKELPESAKEYLRFGLYYEDSWYDDLSDEDKAIVDASKYPDDIPDDVLYRAFEDVVFVPEDFCCDAGDNWDFE